MHNWFCKNLGDPLLAQPALAQVTHRFNTAFEQAERPRDMAVFIRHESEGRLQCELMLYFTPAAADIAQELDAIRCRKPAPGDMGLLAGSESAIFLLEK